MSTVRNQLATVWDYISGAGVKVADNKVAVWRDGRWHFFCTFEGIDEIGYFRFGEGVYLYAIQDCVLTYGGMTWQLNAGWNNIGWVPPEDKPKPPAVEITSVSAQPSRVARGGQLQVTTWVKVRQAFTGYITISILEPPDHRSFRSSTSGPWMNWPVGSYSVTNEVTIDPQNALGDNIVRVLIIDQTLGTVARDDSQIVEVIGQEEAPPSATLTALDIPAEIGQGEDLAIRVQGEVNTPFEGWFTAVLLEPPGYDSHKSTGSSAMLSFSPPRLDNRFTLRVHPDNAPGVNRLRVRLVSGGQPISEITQEITVTEAIAPPVAPPVLAAITSVEAPPEVQAGRVLPIRVQGTIESPLEGHLSAALFEPPAYNTYRSFTSTVGLTFSPPGFDIAMELDVVADNTPGINQLHVSLVSQGKSIARMIVEVTVREPDRPPEDITPPMAGMMGMAMMAVVISEMIEGVEIEG